MEYVFFDNRFEIELNRKVIFHMMDCYEDSPVYEEVCDLYEEIKPWFYDHVKPEAVLYYEPWSDEFFEKTGLKESFAGFIYSCMTLGSLPEKRVTQAFDEGDYLLGMLLNAMADDYLFQMEDAMADRLREMSAQLRLGVAKRLTAPEDLPLEFHEHIFAVSGVRERLGLSLSTGFMFAPVKTNCVIYAMSEDTKIFEAHHDCSRCSVTHCKLRQTKGV